MIKRHRKAQGPLMRRACRIYLAGLNVGKASTLMDFLRLTHDITQYFVDLFWQRKDFSADLADLPTVHRGRNRFGCTTRLGQALAKQAKEAVRSQIEKGRTTKPVLRRHTVTLYSHFVTVEPFHGAGFDMLFLDQTRPPRQESGDARLKPFVMLWSPSWMTGD